MARMLDQRLRLTIFPFEQKGEFSPASHAFQDDFLLQMVRPQRFQVVERERLDLILQEQRIGRSQLIDTPTALRLGRLAAAQAVVAGAMIETHTGIEIVGRVIDSETAVILCALDVYGEDKTSAGLRDLARALSLKIHREFPLADGTVVQRTGDAIVTDLGNEELRAQRRILVYRESPIRDLHGNIAGMDQQVLGHAWITDVQEQVSKAILATDSDRSIHTLHHVIPQ